MNMIETKKLRKVFGPIEAVKGVSFRVDKGEVLGFLGPNGAGKSTVMRMLTCFLTPTSGTALVGGHDILTDSLAARRMVGYVPESNPVYGDMSVVSFLRFIAEMRGFRGAEIDRRVASAMDTCWLDSVRQQIIETLSKGFKRRVGLAQALLHDPEILILDEPTDGLDPNQKHEVRTLIRRMAPDKAIVISTHVLEEVEAVCTRAIIIADGRILEDKTPAQLLARSRHHGAVRLTVAGDGLAGVERALTELRNVSHVETVDSIGATAHFTVFPKPGNAISRDVIALAFEKKWKIQDIHVETGDLNEVFRDITTKEGVHS
jgi:ABC-2 type transport system ATP-binding protein